MNTSARLPLLAAVALALGACGTGPVMQTDTTASPATTDANLAKSSPPQPMSFFITSTGSGKGGDLGGLAGADRHCQALARAAGAGHKMWQAYLSTRPLKEGGKAIDARNRIGKGPWHNARGELIANDVDTLHHDNNLTRHTALNEKGERVNGRGDTPNNHDILTGSDSYGRGFTGKQDTTCGNWTRSSGGSAQVGHHDRLGLSDKVHAQSWVHAHPSRGCSPEELRSTGGAGLFYCFAIN